MSRATRSLAAGREARREGDLREAARLSGDAFARFQRRGDETGMASALVEIAVVALDGDDDDTASRALAQALALVGPVSPEVPVTAAEAGRGDVAPGDRAVVVGAITVVARLAAAGDDPETAVRLYAGAAVCGVADSTLEAVRDHVGGAVLKRSRALMGAGAVTALEVAGGRMTPGEVVALARARCAR